MPWNQRCPELGAALKPALVWFNLCSFSAAEQPHAK